MENNMPDYRWMTKVAIHLLDNVEDFIVQYQIPEEDIATIKNLWEKSLTDWKSFKSYSKIDHNNLTFEKESTFVPVSARKIQSCKLETKETTFKKKHCYRNAKIVNRINAQHISYESEEDLIDRYLDELSYQKAKKLSDLISFYEEEDLSISPSLSIA